MSLAKISLVLCAYNPREDYLNRVFSAVEKLDYPEKLREFIVVDNASTPPLKERKGLNIPSFARIIVEPRQGIVFARICGIQNSQSDHLVFIDDDNLLAEDYLQRLSELYEKHPQVGVWCGNIDLVFEQTPDPWTKPFWRYLAKRSITRESWSNMFLLSPLPCGAGMSVRRDVALEYVKNQLNIPASRKMGRVGKNFMAGDDTEIGLTACRMGLGCGDSHRLKVEHLIPPQRLEREYLKKMAKAVAYSHEWLHLEWKLKEPRAKKNIFWIWVKKKYHRFTQNPDSLFEKCRTEGLRAAQKDFKESAFGKS